MTAARTAGQRGVNNSFRLFCGRGCLRQERGGARPRR